MPVSSLHSEAAVGLALLEERCNGLLSFLQSRLANERDATVDELNTGYCPPVAKADLAASLSWLESAGALRTLRGPMPQVSVRYRATDLLPSILHDARVATAAVAEVRKRPRPEDIPLLVVSWPHSFPPLRSTRWRSSRLAIIDLLESAKSSVIMMFPFVDRAGIDEIAAAVERALRRGVTVTLVTRYLRDPESPNACLVQRIGAIGEPCRERFRPLQLVGGLQKQDIREVLHAKVMVVDGGERGYVGSANLTGTALDESLEIGVLIGENAAAALGALLREIVALADAP